MRLSLICLLVLISLRLALGDEQLRSTQEELRRRNIYFGDVDGRQSGELTEALRRYQARKGFTATGRPDHDTLRSLGLTSRQPGEPPPKPLEWPQEPVLKSDQKVNAPAEAAIIAKESGVTPGSLEASSSFTSISSPAGGTSAAGATPAAASGQWAVAPETSRHGALFKMHGTVAGPQRVTDTDIKPIVTGYFHAVSGNKLRDELHYYADRVSYFSNGVIDRRIVERSLEQYYRRWPSHHYRVAGPLRYARLPRRGQVEITCPVEFTLKRGRTVVKGTTFTVLVIDGATRDPRIVSIQERRIQGG